jgi:hypothetical protein
VNRRSGPPNALARLLVTLVAALVAVTSTVPMTAHATVPPTDEPIVTANPFLPEQQDLTDCVGLVERPGCGSESRGGLHQNLVAIVMIVGLLLVFGRVAWVIRRSQQRAAESVPSD